MKKLLLIAFVFILNITGYSQCNENNIGCTDEIAFNYDPNAVCVGENSCSYECYGCLDPEACNYNPNATISGPCDFDITFNVNMNCYTNSYSTVYITGPFNNWCGDWDPMADNDGDGIWSRTKSFSNRYFIRTIKHFY